jgi:hypothetical protein
MKKNKPAQNVHANNTQYGSGDYYGTGIKQPVGKMRESAMDYGLSMPTSVKKAPRDLA